MESKIEGRNYKIRICDEYPVKLNKKKTDEMLTKLKKSLSLAQEVIKNAYDENYDLYRLINDQVFSAACEELEDGRNWKIGTMLDEVEALQETLATHNDDVPDYNDILDLEDLGFKPNYDHYMWEKVVKDTNDVEVVEEIQLVDGVAPYRLRTIEYDVTNYGRSSRKIEYRTLRKTKKMSKAIENTREKYHEDLDRRYQRSSRGVRPR